MTEQNQNCSSERRLPFSGLERKPSGLLAFVFLGACAYGLGVLLSLETQRLLQSSATGAQVQPRRAKPSGVPAAESATADSTESIVSGSPFLADPARALQVFANKAREFDRVGFDWVSELHQVQPLLHSLSSNDCAAAWTMLKTLRSPSVREQLQDLLLLAWSERDPRTALAALLALPDGLAHSLEHKHEEFPRNHLRTVLLKWADKEPEAALAWASQLPEGEQRALATLDVACGLAYKNPVKAARVLAALPADCDRDPAFLSVIRGLAPVDCDAAMALLDQVQNPSCRSECLSVIGRAKLARDVPDALAWAQTSLTPKEREEILPPLVGDWASQDARAAAAWVSQLPDGRLRQETWKRVSRSWMEDDPQAATDFLFDSLRTNQNSAPMFKDAATRWFSPTDEEQARQWANRLPADAQRDAFISGMCDGLRDESPELAARLALSMSPGEMQTEALEATAKEWLDKDCEEPATWAATLPDGPARTALLPLITETWSTRNPEAAARWLQSLPSDDARAKAAETYVGQTAETHPELAAQWVNSIADENRRVQQIEVIAGQWLKTDRPAARAWLQQTTLPAARIQFLLEQ